MVPQDDLPLAGVRVLELGQLIAGPFAGQLLGYVSSFWTVPQLRLVLHRVRQYVLSTNGFVNPVTWRRDHQGRAAHCRRPYSRMV